jgi:hypothetical protein
MILKDFGVRIKALDAGFLADIQDAATWIFLKRTALT